MPKEYTHWCLAEAVIEKAAREAWNGSEEARILRHALESNRYAFYLGAVSPDMLFYYRKGPLATVLPHAGERLHLERRADPFDALRRFAASGHPQTRHAWAFMAGFACHVVADAVFHPLVFYITGLSRAEHYAFESTLDVFFEGNMELRNHGSMARILRKLEMTLDEAAALSEFIFFPRGGATDRSELVSCLRQYGATQPLFRMLPVAWLVSLLTRFKPALSDNRWSFYRPVMQRWARVFGKTLLYRNPASGEQRSETVFEMRDRVVETLYPLLRDIFVALDREGSESALREITNKARGAHFITGQEPGAVGSLEHFHPQGLAGLFEGWKRPKAGGQLESGDEPHMGGEEA